MAGIQLHPYLNFDGKTEEAMKFYSECLGGKLEIMRFGDSPQPGPPEAKNRVMHSTIKTDTLTLMASDTMPGQPFEKGSQCSLSLNFSSKDELQRTWDKFSKNGSQVTMPLGEQFFGTFGMIKDKYGCSWMFHFATPPQK